MFILILLILSVGLIVGLSTRLQVHPFLALILAALFFGIAVGMPPETLITAINQGFGGTMGSIGLVIVLGVMIGALLEETGGAYKLAEAVLNIIGRNRVHEAMGFIGYLVSIPVFADSGFIILNPLNKSLSKKAGLSMAGTAVALILGLLLTHVMVPPTPGPIAAAGILGADIGLVMLLGLGTSLLCLVVAIFYAKWVGKKVYLDPNPELTESDIKAKMATAPSAFKTFLPIVIPILLIVMKSTLDFWYGEEKSLGLQWLSFIGTPVIALLIGLGVALFLPAKWDKHFVSHTGVMGRAIKDAANILLITGAGGIFGKVLQLSGIADELAPMVSGLEIGIWVPFLVAALIKTAQGSSTVALITTASILAPLADSLGFVAPIEKALLVVAIGAGSLVVSHANDSAFWVVTQMTGMKVGTGYRVYSLGTLIVGFFAACLLFLASLFI